MFHYTLKRLAIATLLLLIIASFLLMHAAPGNPFTSERPLPPQVMDNIIAKYRLDKPILPLASPLVRKCYPILC